MMMSGLEPLLGESGGGCTRPRSDQRVVDWQVASLDEEMLMKRCGGDGRWTWWAGLSVGVGTDVADRDQARAQCS